MAKQTAAAVVMVPLSRVQPDEHQPRKNFDPDRLASLMQSIEKHGIMNPLVLEGRPDGNYLLVDGERRYRASQELGLREVPAIVVSAQNDTERLIQQFHIQEQHEGWSSVEKASAVAKLASELKMEPTELGSVLGLPTRTVETYAAFASLIERKEFEKHETPIVYATRIMGLKKRLRRIFANKELEFSKDDERNLELAIISRIKSGDIRIPNDVVKISDAALLDPNSVMKFIKSDKMSVQKLFLESQAKVAMHFRNIVYAAYSLSSHIPKGMELKVESLFEDNAAAVQALRKAQENIDLLLGKAS